MVWGCISAASTGELQLIEGTMNALRHTKAENDPLPSCLQQDNNPKDNSKLTTALLNKLIVFVIVLLACHVSRPKPDWASVTQTYTLLRTPVLWCHHGGLKENSIGNLWSYSELHREYWYCNSLNCYILPSTLVLWWEVWQYYRNYIKQSRMGFWYMVQMQTCTFDSTNLKPTRRTSLLLPFS